MGFPWDFNGIQWDLEGFNGISGNSLGFEGVQWDLGGVQWGFNGIQWDLGEFYGVQWDLGGFNGMQSDHCGLLGSLIGGEGHTVTWRPLWGSRTPPRPPTIPPPPLGGTRSPLAYCSLRPPEGALCAPLRDAEEPLGSFGVADDFEITPDPRLGSAMGTSHCHCHRVDVGLPMGRPQGSYGALHGAMGHLWGTVGCYGALWGNL